MTQPPIHLWLRAETKKNEKRTALTPTAVKTLIENGTSLTKLFNEASIGLFHYFESLSYAYIRGISLCRIQGYCREM